MGRRNRRNGAYSPGNRARRWRAVHQESMFIDVAVGITCIVLVGGTVGCLIGLVMLICGALSHRDGKRGWRINYDIPSYAWDQADRCEVSRSALESTLEEARDPDRPQYAFDPRLIDKGRRAYRMRMKKNAGHA